MRQVTTPIPLAEYCGIRCTERSLCEIDSGKVMVTVPRQDITRITLRYGTQAPHPVIQVVMGLLLTGLGYFPIAHLIDWLRHGGAFLTLEAWIVPFPVVGILTVIGAFKRGYFLLVDERQGSKRLSFSTQA